MCYFNYLVYVHSRNINKYTMYYLLLILYSNYCKISDMYIIFYIYIYIYIYCVIFIIYGINMLTKLLILMIEFRR